MLDRVPKYSGRAWSDDDLDQICDLIKQNADATRARLSRLVCEHFDWRAPNGKLKEMSCRVAMLAMHRDGRIELPAPRWAPPPPYRLVPTPQGDPQPPWQGSVRDLTALRLVPVEPGRAPRLWNELVSRYHYLGYRMLPGAQMRYLLRDGERVLGAMGFGAAAWKLAPRDQFIGWSGAERERGLYRIVGQSRFLILPWIRCRNLASKALAMATARLGADWAARYGFAPVLLETFVDTTRFAGTCYRAANWIEVGTTQGRGKLDRYRRYAVPVKRIYLKPLAPDFRRCLRQTA